MINVSFEFFPPKTSKGLDKLIEHCVELKKLNPEYVSVTYGAGGSTRDKTLETVTRLTKIGLDVAPHISSVASTQQEIEELLNIYHDHGIKRLVVLRGDLPSGVGKQSGQFSYACDLVSFIREKYNSYFHIEVAAYPEKHPQALSFQDDLRHFAHKVACGANRAITQYFYNEDAYFYFCHLCLTHNIKIDIIPGVMPIYDLQNLTRFSTTCGAEIPLWIRRHLENLSADEILEFNKNFMLRFCKKLVAAGTPGLHFYTLNKLQPCFDVAQALQHEEAVC